MIPILVTDVTPDRLQVTMKGKCAPAEVLDLIDQTRVAAETSQRTKVLVDCRELEVELSETDRFQSGLRVAEVFGSRYKVVVVMPLGSVTKMGELAAVNRGASLLVTDSMDEAVSWLLDQ